MVAGSGGTRVLATSRTPLRIPGERLLPVEPLSVPDLRSALDVDELGWVPSVALFVERLQDGVPSFVLTGRNSSVVAEICVALGGLPLAIELAAVHSCSLGLDEVLARSRGRFELPPARRAVALGHRSLRAALDWSLDRLAPVQRDVLAALSGRTHVGPARVCRTGPIMLCACAGSAARVRTPACPAARTA